MKNKNFFWHRALASSIDGGGIPVQQNQVRQSWRGWKIPSWVVLSALALSSVQAATSVQLTSPSAGSVGVGTTLGISATANDPDGNLREHWLEVKRPAGDWSWEGWLTGEPWGPVLGGDNFNSAKTGSYTFSNVGTYVVRSTALNADGVWVISDEISITVVNNTPPRVTLNGPESQVIVRGSSLTIAGTATDEGGDLREHWLEIRRPAGDYSWQGWLTGPPWDGALGGDGFASSKAASFTFDDVGIYIVRTTAVDSSGEWQISEEISIRVVESLEDL